MSAHRFFLTGPLEGVGEVTLPLSEGDVHHAVNVLRLRVGEEVDAVEPSGRLWRVRVTTAEKGAVRAEPLREVSGVAALPRLTLVMGVAKGDKMDVIVRQATELGVERVIPVLCERSVVRLTPAKAAEKTERWRRIAHAAAKQAKRVDVPEVAVAVPLRDALAELAACEGVIVAWEESSGAHIARVARAWADAPSARVAVVVGPEGGLTASEVAALEAIGAHSATLGPTILRAETAAVAAIAVVISAMSGPGDGDD